MLKLIAGTPPRPAGRALSVTDVPDDLLLRAASGPQRATLLVGLALHEPLPLDALHRVASECNALALEQTLELLARRGELGFVVSALGLEWLLQLGRARGVAVNDVLATTDTVSRRGLTTREAKRVHENFAGTLDPATVRLSFTAGVQTMGAGAMALGNTIHIDPSDPRFQVKKGTTLAEFPDDEGWDSFNGILLAHEPTHVWSYQHQGSRYAVNSVVDQLRAMQSGDRGGAYLYKPDRAHFLEYGEEQRAMIVQDWVAAVRGKATGDTTSLTLYGGTKPVDEAIAALRPYIDQMRAMGPGVPEPSGRQAEWILCACVTRGFVQDGLAATIGAQGSALINAAGRAATQAVTQGLAKHDAAQVAAGVAGVAAAAVASVLPREQAGYGGTSGGSAILDQAGIPRGVELEKDGVAMSAKAAWDAPAREPGMKDPRIEWQASVHRDVGDTRVDANARAVVATAGDVRRAEASVRVEKGDAALGLRGGVVPERAKTAGKAWARVELETDVLDVELGGTVTSKAGRLQTVSVDTHLTAQQLMVDASAQLARARADAPLALEAAEVSVAGRLTPNVSAGLGARLVPAGLDGLSAQVAAQGDAGSIAVRATAEHLTTAAPSVGVAVTATEKKSGVTIGANVETTPAKGEVQGGVTLSLPLPVGRGSG